MKAILKGTNPSKEEHAKRRQLEDTGNKVFIISSNFEDITFFIYTKKHVHFKNIIAYCMPLHSNFFLGGFELSYSASQNGILKPKWLDILQFPFILFCRFFCFGCVFFVCLFFYENSNQKARLNLKNLGAREESIFHISKARLVFQIMLNLIRQETAISKVETEPEAFMYTST